MGGRQSSSLGGEGGRRKVLLVGLNCSHMSFALWHQSPILSTLVLSLSLILSVKLVDRFHGGRKGTSVIWGSRLAAMQFWKPVLVYFSFQIFLISDISYFSFLISDMALSPTDPNSYSRPDLVTKINLKLFQWNSIKMSQGDNKTHTPGLVGGLWAKGGYIWCIFKPFHFSHV